MAEGGGLLNRYTGENLYRGFESLPLRQPCNPNHLASVHRRWHGRRIEVWCPASVPRDFRAGFALGMFFSSSVIAFLTSSAAVLM